MQELGGGVGGQQGVSPTHWSGEFIESDESSIEKQNLFYLDSVDTGKV